MNHFGESQYGQYGLHVNQGHNKTNDEWNWSPSDRSRY